MNKNEKVSSAGAMDTLSKLRTAGEENIGQCNSGLPQVKLTDATPEQQTNNIEVMVFFNRRLTLIFWSRPFSAACLAASAAIDN